MLSYASGITERHRLFAIQLAIVMASNEVHN